ncbi:hypothetical protein CVT24_000566 [Panaeolus cyanescens]|uniref:Uncharacterized protein n=1 Tax=Panaeolus cyanescens TaxID=181874 RepID=A0A409W712_9AGAR|nr:hypothetical protein CVT24_000566 [Panaeolus cyanescens]
MTSGPIDRLSVIVDSISPSIQYEGDWTNASPTPDKMNMTEFIGEPPFSDVLRQVPRQNVVSLSHKFNGTRIQVQGTIAHPSKTMGWKATCTVDGRNVDVYKIWGISQNQFPFCEGRYLSSTSPHSLNFTIEILDDDTNIWFDRLMVSPAPFDNSDHPIVQVLHTDPMISYTDHWKDYVTGLYTNVTGSKVSIDFNGTALRWYTIYEATFSAVRSQAKGTLFIDNQPIPFVIPEIKPSVDVQMGELLFRTPELPPGLHSAEVTYDGFGRPLALYYLVIENIPKNRTIPTVPPTFVDNNKVPSSSVAAPNFGISRAVRIGLCGGIGLLAAIIIIAVLVLYIRRRRQRRNLEQSTTQPFSLSFLSLSALGPFRATNPKSTALEQLPQLRTAQPEENPPPYEPGIRGPVKLRRLF